MENTIESTLVSPAISGYLFRKGYFNDWRKRYVELKDSVIYYSVFKGALSSGKFKLGPNTRCEDSSAKHFCFVVSDPEEEPLYFAAENVAIKEAWTESIQSSLSLIRLAHRKIKNDPSETVLNQYISRPLIYFKIIRAINLMPKDSIGLSDPYVMITMGASTVRTTTRKKNLNPEWGMVFPFDWDRSMRFAVVEVWDEDYASAHDFLGKVIIPIFNLKDGDTRLGWYPLGKRSSRSHVRGAIEIEIACVGQPDQDKSAWHFFREVQKLPELSLNLASSVDGSGQIALLHRNEPTTRNSFADDPPANGANGVNGLSSEIPLCKSMTSTRIQDSDGFPIYFPPIETEQLEDVSMRAHLISVVNAGQKITTPGVLILTNYRLIFLSITRIVKKPPGLSTQFRTLQDSSNLNSAANLSNMNSDGLGGYSVGTVLGVTNAKEKSLNYVSYRENNETWSSLSDIQDLTTQIPIASIMSIELSTTNESFSNLNFGTGSSNAFEIIRVKTADCRTLSFLFQDDADQIPTNGASGPPNYVPAPVDNEPLSDGSYRGRAPSFIPSNPIGVLTEAVNSLASNLASTLLGTVSGHGGEVLYNYHTASSSTSELKAMDTTEVNHGAVLVADMNPSIRSKCVLPTDDDFAMHPDLDQSVMVIAEESQSSDPWIIGSETVSLDPTPSSSSKEGPVPSVSTKRTTAHRKLSMYNAITSSGSAFTENSFVHLSTLEMLWLKLVREHSVVEALNSEEGPPAHRIHNRIKFRAINRDSERKAALSQHTQLLDSIKMVCGQFDRMSEAIKSYSENMVHLLASFVDLHNFNDLTSDQTGITTSVKASNQSHHLPLGWSNSQESQSTQRVRTDEERIREQCTITGLENRIKASDHLVNTFTKLLYNLENGWNVYDPSVEFKRMQIPDAVWRLTSANRDYSLCATYPAILAVPATVEDETLVGSSSFRSKGRLPVLCWRSSQNHRTICRSSQPLVGLSNNRNFDDEILIEEIHRASVLDDRLQTGGTVSPHRNPLQQNWDQSGSFQRHHITQLTGAISKPISKATLRAIAKTARQTSPTPPPGGDPPSGHGPPMNGPSGLSGRDGGGGNNGGGTEFPKDGSVQYIIVDARPLLNARANQAAGKGVESEKCYDNAAVLFMDIANIHAVRRSLEVVEEACTDEAAWLKNLESSGWLGHIRMILLAATRITHILAHENLSVLVHCSDGWDRTAQLTSLSMLLLDDYYRTLDGFIVLIEKEWVSFGHKFGDRWGWTPDGWKDEERSPVFLQFLDCVHQCVFQRPEAFEFNQDLLVLLAEHLHSGWFGNFLFNSEKELLAVAKQGGLISIWTYVLGNRDLFTNHSYSPSPSPFLPVVTKNRLVIWSKWFLRWHDRLWSLAWVDINQVELKKISEVTFSGTWVDDRTVTHCTKCHLRFTFFKRKHHCRCCGKIFCESCAGYLRIIPSISTWRPSRVCIDCARLIDDLSETDTQPTSTGGGGEMDSSSIKGGTELSLNQLHSTSSPSNPSTGGLLEKQHSNANMLQRMQDLLLTHSNTTRTSFASSMNNEERLVI